MNNMLQLLIPFWGVYYGCFRMNTDNNLSVFTHNVICFLSVIEHAIIFAYFMKDC